MQSLVELAAACDEIHYCNQPLGELSENLNQLSPCLYPSLTILCTLSCGLDYIEFGSQIDRRRTLATQLSFLNLFLFHQYLWQCHSSRRYICCSRRSSAVRSSMSRGASKRNCNPVSSKILLLLAGKEENGKTITYLESVMIFTIGHVWVKLYTCQSISRLPLALPTAAMLLVSEVKELKKAAKINPSSDLRVQCCRCGVMTPLSLANKDKINGPAIKVSDNLSTSALLVE